MGSPEFHILSTYHHTLFEVDVGTSSLINTEALDEEGFMNALNRADPAIYNSTNKKQAPVDWNLAELLGGNRGTECRENAQGPCTYRVYIGNSEYTGDVMPAWEFDLRGEDPTFLGGWLSDDAPFG